MYEKMICTSCGGPIDTVRMVCPYCGTKYRSVKSDAPVLPKIVRVENPQVHTLAARFEYPPDRRLTAAQVSKMAIKVLTDQLAEALGPYLTLETGHNMITGNVQITGKIRLVSPDFRF